MKNLVCLALKEHPLYLYPSWSKRTTTLQPHPNHALNQNNTIKESSHGFPSQAFLFYVDLLNILKNLIMTDAKNVDQAKLQQFWATMKASLFWVSNCTITDNEQDLKPIPYHAPSRNVKIKHKLKLRLK